ncbi:MAG: ribosomal protein S18-alanine N-acetyltransferase [Oscillospiraceae bacterium]|nr:ribosomal protein S18-alanine N-acetyltransferase [Oscillospiraceae bacterium]
MADYTIRPMAARDIEEVAAMEQSIFAMPWSRASFERELNENPVARYLVLEEGGRVAAYGGVWLIIDEAHVTNIAVRPDVRGKGYGEAIARALMKLAGETCMYMITLEVRRSNAAAQALYRKLGFQDVGYRKRYYEDNGEDALIMYAALPSPQGQ